MKKIKIVFCFLGISLFTSHSTSFEMKKFLNQLIKFSPKHYCKSLIHLPEGLYKTTISCDDCFFGAKKTYMMPYQGCCGNFIQEKQKREKVFPFSIDILKKYTEI